MTAEVAPSPPIVVRCQRDVVTVDGPDAVAYLQGQLSQDVAALAVGAVAWSFILSPQGKVDGWGRVHRTADARFEIDVDPGAGAAWDARLRRFLLRTKAELALVEGIEATAVRGATVDGALPLAAPWAVGGDLLTNLDEVEVLPDGVVGGTAADLEATRIRAGIPAWGTEIDVDTIPATLGQWAIDASVSFTKGCYTGQELVARIDSRGGHVPRALVGLEIDGPAPASGAAVVVGGEDVAVVTSSARWGAGSVALAFLPRSVELPGPIAASAGGADAIVRPLPLPGPR
ncbi:MAG: folate-binding protein YgfZ [Acidimicrobiales bacterium]|nr:folate-binding protein YgfZ [Acidimicrobiales bacterium]